MGRGWGRRHEGQSHPSLRRFEVTFQEETGMRLTRAVLGSFGDCVA